jgi:hypothetical protein
MSRVAANAPGCADLGSVVSTLACFCTSSAAPGCSGTPRAAPSKTPGPRRRLPAPGRSSRGAGSSQQIGPRLRGLAIAVGQRDQLFAAVGTDPDHHQQAQFLLLEPNLQVDAVDPQVDEVGAREVALLK